MTVWDRAYKTRRQAEVRAQNRRRRPPFVDLPGEEWRVIPGFDGLYEASNLGRIRSWARFGPSTGGSPRREIPLLLRPRLIRGYEYVYRKGGVGGLVSRLVLLAFVGPPPSEGLAAAHQNGDKRDNRPSNLAWMTARDNNLQKREHGTMARGTDTHFAKLTEDDVRNIRALAKTVARRELAKRFGVNSSSIGAILTRRTWAHVV